MGKLHRRGEKSKLTHRKTYSHESKPQDKEQKTHSQRLLIEIPSHWIQISFLLLGLLLAYDHIFLSFPAGSEGPHDGRDLLSQDCLLSQQQTNDVSLDIISKEVSCSTRLTDAEKEKLEGTLRKLQQQEKEAAAAAKITAVEKRKEAAAKATAAPVIATETLPPLKAKNPYAYLFLVHDVHETRNDYKGYLYDVLVSAYLLQQLGSKADVVLLVQKAADSKLNEGLPADDVQALRALDIQVQEIPKRTDGGQHWTQFERLRALQMTQYQRVLFLISDAMPLANLDYLFHLSDPDHKDTPTLIQPNLILASRGEPCTSAMFMVRPEAGAWETVVEPKVQQQLTSKTKDYANGWGYNFQQEHDTWRATVKTGDMWRFHGGFTDQGLLYYWTKFHKRQVSIVIQDEVENWVNSDDAPKTAQGNPKPILQNTLTDDALQKYSREHPLAYQFECDLPKIQEKDKKHQPQQCVVPYRDYVHMFGTHKPWISSNNPELAMARKNSKDFNNARSLWFTTLKELNALLSLGLDFDHPLLDQPDQKEE